MANISVSTYEAKAQLSKLLAACERGDNVVILRGNQAVAQLTPVKETPQREYGFLSLRLSESSVAASLAPLNPMMQSSSTKEP